MIKWILYVLMGGGAGVLINYLADVLPQTRKFSRPVCQKCEHPYTARNYLISFRCKNCGKGPSVRSILVLVISILCSVLLGMFPLSTLDYWTTLPIIVFLGLIIVIDIEHHAILIETSIFGIVLFFIYGWLLQGVLFTLIGGVAGFLIMFLIYLFGLVFSKGLGKIRKREVGEEGMGFGDVYAGAFLGLFTGWPYVIGMIIIAILASGIFSFIYILIKSFRKDYQLASTIPYAPFLILGAIAVNYIPPLPL